MPEAGVSAITPVRISEDTRDPAAEYAYIKVDSTLLAKRTPGRRVMAGTLDIRCLSLTIYRSGRLHVERLGGRPKLMAKEKSDLLQGTLDMLILKALQLEPMHGFGISVRIRQISEDVLRVEQGSLYPALYRLEEQGWVKASWGVSENNRKARFYELTKLGRKQLEKETANWERLSLAINQVLGARLENLT